MPAARGRRSGRLYEPRKSTTGCNSRHYRHQPMRVRNLSMFSSFAGATRHSEHKSSNCAWKNKRNLEHLKPKRLEPVWLRANEDVRVGHIRTHSQTGLTLGGLRFTVYIFIFLRPAPKTQSTHEGALELVSGADLWCNLHSFSSRSRSQGSRGPPWAPRGRKSDKSQGTDLSFYTP